MWENRAVDDQGTLHLIEDDLAETWLEDWARGGIGELEIYLAKHLAFQSFLDKPSA